MSQTSIEESISSQETNESVIDNALEQKINDWLDKNGIFMETPEPNFKRIRGFSEVKLQLNCELFLKRRSQKLII